MPLLVITAPETEPLTLEECKLYLRQEADFEDAVIERMIRAARRWIEAKTWRALAVQTLELQMERFPVGPLLVLPRPVLLEVESIHYLSNGAWVEMVDGVEVDLSSQPGRLRALDGWPTTDTALTAVKVRYTAGWTPDEVPDELTQALLMLVSAFYTHREGLPEDVRNAVELLIGDYCLRSLAELPYLRGTEQALEALAAGEASWPN